DVSLLAKQSPLGPESTLSADANGSGLGGADLLDSINNGRTYKSASGTRTLAPRHMLVSD
ncbi:unnamed protein product, partial [Amoebophrya sp. A25]